MCYWYSRCLTTQHSGGLKSRLRSESSLRADRECSYRGMHRVIRVFILCLRSPGRRMVEEMMHWCSEKVEYRNVAYLFLLTYVFLLRLPSEALPVVAGQGVEQACLFREGQTVVLELKRRKNKPAGSRLVRTCWCSVSEVSLCLFEQQHLVWLSLL